MGPIQLIPHHGSGWAPQKLPERLRATYSKKMGVRYVFGAYDVHADRLHGRLAVRGRDQAVAPGHLSRQGPPTLRWALFEAAQTARRISSTNHHNPDPHLATGPRTDRRLRVGSAARPASEDHRSRFGLILPMRSGWATLPQVDAAGR